MSDYTTQQAADLLGDITADGIRKYAARHLTEDKEYRKINSRLMLINELGIERLRNRNLKRGPKTNRSKAA